MLYINMILCWFKQLFSQFCIWLNISRIYEYRREGLAYREGFKDGFAGEMFVDMDKIEENTPEYEYINGFREGQKNRMKNLGLTHLIVLLCVLHTSTAEKYFVCSLDIRDNCLHTSLQLRENKDFVLCCEGRNDRTVKIYDETLKESNILENNDIISCDIEIKSKTIVKELKSYHEECFQEENGECSCLSLEMGRRRVMNCAQTFPREMCFKSKCSIVYKIMGTNIGCKLKKYHDYGDYDLSNTVPSVDYSTECGKNTCVLNNGRPELKVNMSGITMEVIYNETTNIHTNYKKVYIIILLIVLVLLVYMLIVRRINIEIIKCTTCNNVIIRGVKHSCTDDSEEAIESYVEKKRLTQISWVTLLIILLSVTEVVSSDICDKHCFLMNSLKDDSDTFTLQPHFRNLRYLLSFKDPDYSYLLHEEPWSMSNTKDNCEKYNVRRHWTYHYKWDNNSNTCSGLANYAVKGDLSFKFDSKNYDEEIVGQNCFKLPGISKITCLNTDKFENDVYDCIHILSKQKSNKLKEDAIEYLNKDFDKFFNINLNGVFRTAIKYESCTYVKQKQPDKFDIKFDPYNYSELCYRGKSTYITTTRTDDVIRYTDEGVVLSKEVEIPSELKCKIKGHAESKCLFTYKINKHNMTEIIPNCKDGYVIKVNNTKVALPCSISNIPIISRQTRYEICGHRLVSKIHNTNYMCNCSGPITVDYVFQTKNKERTVKPMNLIIYCSAVYYAVTIFVLARMWLIYLINGKINKSITRNVIDVFLSFHDELTPEERLNKGLFAFNKQKNIQGNIAMAKLNSINKMIKAQKSVKTKSLNMLNKFLNPKPVVDIEQRYVEAVFDRGLKVESNFDDFDSSDDEIYTHMRDIEGVYNTPNTSTQSDKQNRSKSDLSLNTKIALGVYDSDDN